MKNASKKIKQVKYIKEKNYFFKYSKIEKSRKCCQRHMLFGLMASVSVAGIMSAVVGGSALLYGVLNKESKNSLQQTYTDTCGLTQEEISIVEESLKPPAKEKGKKAAPAAVPAEPLNNDDNNDDRDH